MQLPLQSFVALVQQMAASVQGAAAQLIDLSVGSVLRALLEERIHCAVDAMADPSGAHAHPRGNQHRRRS
jgi:hypothetical protein